MGLQHADRKTVTESPAADREDQQLRLERLEAKLVTGLFEHPGVVRRSTEHQLRYAIRLAALDTFQPGAARRGKRNGHADVRVRSPRLGRWRQRIAEGMADILLGNKDSRARIEEAARFLQTRLVQMDQVRNEILEKYADEFSERDLDQEIGIKTLVSVAGGGGGSGYVYIGAWEVLQNAGLVPGYVIGASIGSVLGLFRALRKDGDWDEYAGFAKSMSAEEVFSIRQPPNALRHAGDLTLVPSRGDRVCLPRRGRPRPIALRSRNPFRCGGRRNSQGCDHRNTRRVRAQSPLAPRQTPGGLAAARPDRSPARSIGGLHQSSGGTRDRGRW